MNDPAAAPGGDLSELGYVVASKMVGEDGMAACWLYRIDPPDDFDSGWRVFSGMEDDDYVADPENLGVFTPEAIVEADPMIAEILLSPPGSAFERDAPGQPFISAPMPE